MIHVIDKYVIDTDGRQYVVGKLASRTLKDGTTEEYIKDPCYYRSIAVCLEAISSRLRMAAIKRTDGDLEAAYKAIQGADNRLIKVISTAFDGIEVIQRAPDAPERPSAAETD